MDMWEGVLLLDFWSAAEVPTDWYGNRIIGKGTCSLHKEVYMITSPAWNTPDCIWCYHVEVQSMGAEIPESVEL